MAESPARRVLFLSTPLQEATTLLPSDGHGFLDNNYNYHLALQVAQSPLTKSGVEISSGKKRKGVELLSDGDNIDKTGRIDRSPEVHKSGNSEREKVGDQTWKEWADVWLLFILRINYNFSCFICPLNFTISCRF